MEAVAVIISNNKTTVPGYRWHIENIVLHNCWYADEEELPEFNRWKGRYGFTCFMGYLGKWKYR